MTVALSLPVDTTRYWMQNPLRIVLLRNKLNITLTPEHDIDFGVNSKYVTRGTGRIKHDPSIKECDIVSVKSSGEIVISPNKLRRPDTRAIKTCLRPILAAIFSSLSIDVTVTFDVRNVGGRDPLEFAIVNLKHNGSTMMQFEVWPESESIVIDLGVEVHRNAIECYRMQNMIIRQKQLSSSAAPTMSRW